MSEVRERKGRRRKGKRAGNKHNGWFDSFGDDLIRLLQDQFTILMNSISQHIERFESYLVRLRKFS